MVKGKSGIVPLVISSAMHIIYDSDFKHPRNGIKIGNSFGKDIKYCLWMGCNAYGFDQAPVIGRIGVYPGIQSEATIIKQFKALNLILDQSICEGVFFEYELTKPSEFIWFKFTIK
jgi:hypothetical protein